MEGPKVFESILSVVSANTKKPGNYLSVQEDVLSVFRDSVKSLYDFTKEQSGRKTKALPELIIDGFDAEQIWQQLELQNEGEWAHLLLGTSKALAGVNKLTLPIKLNKNEFEENAIVPSVEELRGEERMFADNFEHSSSEDSDKDDLGRPKMKKKTKKEVRKMTKPSVVDDTFFKLQELDEFLNKEDKKAMKDGKQHESDSDVNDEESVDLFDYVSEDGSAENGADPRLAKFKDFFDQPQDDKNANSVGESEEESNEDQLDHPESGENSDVNNLSEENIKRVKFNIDNVSEIDNSEDETGGQTEVKSTLETRQDRLRKRIDDLEKVAISEKPWQLRGEVDAANRPQNSLLEEHVEFDITSRPAPVITEQTTLKLEDIIRQRIKDKAWDDVEKKFKPVETPMEYKKKLILDQEKSKVSLAQVYENEFLKQKEALNPDNDEKEVEEPKEHIEVREMMHSLFTKLDALSNFHYTPKMARPDIKIVSNLPAITMEEVAPVATSDATLLAPEEIRAKPRGDLIGREERTDTDKNRERRHKKLKQREREKAKEKRERLVDRLRPGLGNKYSKEKATKLIDNLSKERNISRIDETLASSAKSSTAFFNQLQDQVKSHIKTKTGNDQKKRDKKSISAVKLKL
ncbi:U3 small nucleolar ribonucleoprotein protein MPP10 [Athalia rosae]|uniref:U3 small nucleolar ribonucleoprotein protein MPP10 n=1 Tax=Athalia rosae TaxID=37344 RepID=UPI0020340127|nr:U3 small nucleolar ribonucleoprotein protein MPP10 [Athalia rosae]